MAQNAGVNASVHPPAIAPHRAASPGTGPDRRLRDGTAVEDHLVAMQIRIGVHKVESRSEERPLRSHVVRCGLGGHTAQTVVDGHGEQARHRLGGVAVTSGRRSQSVPDLNAAVDRLTFEADPSDGPSVGQATDPVEAERTLIPELR